MQRRRQHHWPCAALAPPHAPPAPPSTACLPARRRKFVKCVDTLKATGRHDDAALISVLKPPVALQDSCDYRWAARPQHLALSACLLVHLPGHLPITPIFLLPSRDHRTCHRPRLRPPPPCRYNMYIESDSYASNLKQKLVCGSVLVALRMEYWEWYARGLEAGKHFVELTNEEDHVCEQVGGWVARKSQHVWCREWVVGVLIQCC